MKKLMFAMVAVALATVANAAASYNYNAYAFVKDYAGEGGASPSKYTFYAMTQTTAQQLLGVSTQVSYSDVAVWAKNNGYRPSINALNEVAQKLGYSAYDKDWGYGFLPVGQATKGSNLENSIGIALYNGGDDVYAFNTYSRAHEGSEYYETTFAFNALGPSPSSVSGWTETAFIPEPTSGILLLLGVAGLALKRKQK